MTGESWNGFISVNAAPPGPVASYFLSVSPEWRELMKIPLLQGSDFRTGDALPGSVLVNQAFARQYFGTGRVRWEGHLKWCSPEGFRVRHQIVGLVGDARYKDMREPIQPTAYFPRCAGNYSRATLMVRTSTQNPSAMASVLRREVARAGAGFRVSNIRAQTALVAQHTVRERLLAMLALFFGVVALLLAGIGLYGVLDYSVVQRRREIAIRLAIGAQAGDVAWRVTVDVFATVLAGSLVGMILGIASARLIETLLYEVKATDPGILVLPAAALFAVSVLAALPAVILAVRIDPAAMLRSE